MTNARNYSLKVTLEDVDGEKDVGFWREFRLLDDDVFRLRVSGYEFGLGGDSLKAHNGKGFSTYDRDNDDYASGECAKQYAGAWWYFNCHMSNLNGLNLNKASTTRRAVGIVYKAFRGYRHSLKSVTMAIKAL